MPGVAYRPSKLAGRQTARQTASQGGRTDQPSAHKRQHHARVKTRRGIGNTEYRDSVLESRTGAAKITDISGGKVPHNRRWPAYSLKRKKIPLKRCVGLRYIIHRKTADS